MGAKILEWLTPGMKNLYDGMSATHLYTWPTGRLTIFLEEYVAAFAGIIEQKEISRAPNTTLNTEEMACKI